LADLVRRRLGASFLDYAIDPFISGIYAGNPEMLIPKYALPILYQLEQDYGSFIKGAIQKAKLPKSEWEKKVTKDVFSVESGLQKLTDALASKIGLDNIKTGVTHIETQHLENGYSISYQNKSEPFKTEKADIVISTVSVDAVESIFPFITSSSALEKMKALRYAKIVQVAVGYKQWSGMPLVAFGGLIPSKENQAILGILFPSAIFKGRAPEGGALLSVFMGGIKQPQWYEQTDAVIEKTVTEHLQNLLNSDQKPDLLRIFRYKEAIPQYELSSGERFNAIDEIENTYQGLYLAGNIRNGIGMADRIKQGTDLAKTIITKNNE
jgi:oxygen-dependent protoporphyrinogen oxidase